MMLLAPPPSPYDLNLRLLGFHIRISFTFWIAAVFFGYTLVRSVDWRLGPNSPGMGVLLVLWTLCMLTTIALHELGHAVAFRMFGVHSHIVLYHMGGLAIPTAGMGGKRLGVTLPPAQSLIVSAAGPAIQLASALLLVVGLMLANRLVDGLDYFPIDASRWINADDALPLRSSLGRAAVVFYLFPSIFWALLNCVPVFPLDGGRVVRSLSELFGAPPDVWLWTSVFTSAIIAVYGYNQDQWFLALLFAAMGVSNYQMIASMRRQ